LFEFLKDGKYNPFSLFKRMERPDGEALDVFTPLSVPFRNKFDLVVRKIDPWYFVRQIRRVLRGVNPGNLILFLGNPWNVFLLDHFKDCACSIYHCSDNFPVIFGGEFGEKVAKKEAEMIARVDAVIAVSSPLYEKCRLINSRTFLVGHGVEEAFFTSKNEDNEEPRDLSGICRPRIGYVGSMDRIIDYDLIEYAVMHHSGKQFILVGPVAPDCRRQMEHLKEYRNVHHLGQRSWTVVPQYVRNFDVCIVPRLLTPFVVHSSPLKMIQYLAAGKPVVSTFVPAKLDVINAVRVAAGREEFSEAIDAALSEGGDRTSALRRSSSVKDQTWTNKVEEISKIIEGCIIDKKNGQSAT
jgi:glycosyltransferase involved in cell wall biosynthesis